jgi:hypothetical protein
MGLSVMTEYPELIRRYDVAMQMRDLPAVRRIGRQIWRYKDADRPIDISLLRAIERTYAAEIHGWIIP